MKPVQKEVAGWHLSFERMLWLCASMLLVLAPHVTRIPLWISAVFVLFVAWRLYTVKTGTSLPHRYLLGLVVMLILLGVYLSYHTLTGRNAGVALLAALSGMKILETRNQRDAYVVVFLGFFLVVTNFLYSQSIPTGLYMLVVVMVLTSTLVALTLRESDLKPQHQLRLSAVMLVISSE